MNVAAEFSFHLGSVFFSGLAPTIPPPVYSSLLSTHFGLAPHLSVLEVL